MSRADTVMPLLQGPWMGRGGEKLPVTALPALSRDAIHNLSLQWSGILTPEMHAVLECSCGISGTPIGSVDFTGCWYPEEPLSIFRPCITLAVDDAGRRWVAEAGRTRGLPGPVWCVFPRPEVAMWVHRSLGDFLVKLHHHTRRKTLPQWMTSMSHRARILWATRHASAMAVPVAFTRLRELRGWLAELPLDSWVYDLRNPRAHRGLPYGLARERGELYRCGRLPVFAFANFASPAADAIDTDVDELPQFAQLATARLTQARRHGTA